MEIEKGNGIIVGSLIGFVALIVIAILLSSNLALSTNCIFLAIIVLIVPYSVYKFFELKKIRSYEKMFPNFLRDLAESQRAGLTILQAMKVSTKSDYGALSEEVKKMSNQLSWNITLEEIS